ncbi:hypothetical protein PCIT_a2628 [Pseudoalteromonas citrea]|uniref:Uncharacterized protein n=1 Tax=Pseudoalteromonas citrea TaxID=43655 RepID=A0AAD4FRF2_9GAMM|nr:hypothetical protein PCIT_a2628 [Pseudoalteromonas citrea]
MTGLGMPKYKTMMKLISGLVVNYFINSVYANLKTKTQTQKSRHLAGF